MRIDPDECRDPELLAAEVRRLQSVIATGVPVLTEEERDVLSSAIDAINRQLNAPGLVAALRQLKERVCHDDRVNYLRTPYKSRRPTPPQQYKEN